MRCLQVDIFEGDCPEIEDMIEAIHINHDYFLSIFVNVIGLLNV
jgi:hypothetical protein